MMMMDEPEYDDAAMDALIQRELDALDETDLEDDPDDLEDEDDLNDFQMGEGRVDNENGDEEGIDPCMCEYLSLIKTYNDEAVQRMTENENIINAMANINVNTDELLKEKLCEQLNDVDEDNVMQVWKEVCVDIDLQELEDENGGLMNVNNVDWLAGDIEEIHELETKSREELHTLLQEHHLTEERRRLLEEEKKKDDEKFDILMQGRQEARRKKIEELHILDDDNDIKNNMMQDTLQVSEIHAYEREIHAYEQDMKQKVQIINTSCSAEKDKLQALQDEMVQITTTKEKWAATTIQKYFKRYVVQNIHASEVKQIKEKMKMFRKEKVKEMIKEQERVEAEKKRKQEELLRKKENERLEKQKKEKEKGERKRLYEEQKAIMVQERTKAEQEQKRKQEEEIRKKENERLEEEERRKREKDKILEEEEWRNKEEEKIKQESSVVGCSETTALVGNNENETEGRITLSDVKMDSKESDSGDSAENKKGIAICNSKNNFVFKEDETNCHAIKNESPHHSNKSNNNSRDFEKSKCILSNPENNVSSELNCGHINISGKQNCQNLSSIKKELQCDSLILHTGSVPQENDFTILVGDSSAQDGDSLTENTDSLAQDGNSLTENIDSLAQDGDSLAQEGDSLSHVDSANHSNVASDAICFARDGKSECETDTLKPSNNTILNKNTSHNEQFSCHDTSQSGVDKLLGTSHGITDNSRNHCELSSDIILQSSHLSNSDVQKGISGTCFGLDNISLPPDRSSGSVTKSKETSIDITTKSSLDDMIERISAKRKDRHAKRLAVHAIKIQSLYRGYRVRKAYKEIKQMHCGMDVSSGDSENSDCVYDEVNLDEFVLDDSMMEWTPTAKTPVLSEAPLPNIPSAVTPAQIPIKEAWCRLESRPEVRSSHSSQGTPIPLNSSRTQTETLTEQPSRNTSALSCCKSLSKKANKISDDWGFQNETTAELMLKRAKKLGMGRKKKSSSSQRYQSFKNSESSAVVQSKHASSGQKKPPERIGYFQASRAPPSPLDQKQKLDSKEATYMWVCNQPVLHTDRAREVMSRNSKYYTETLPVQNKDQNMHGSEAIVLPQIDPAILAGKPLALVQSEIHNPKPPSNARSSAGSEKGRKCSPQKKSHSAPPRDAKKLSSSTLELEEKWTRCVYR